MGFLGFSLIILVMFIVIIGLLLFVAATISIGIGGMSVSMLLKNKTVKNLLIVCSLIVFFVGLMVFCPFAVSMAELPALFTAIGIIFFGACIGFLAILGVKFSKVIKNKAIRTILAILFYLVLFAAASLSCFIIIFSLIF